MAATAGMDRSSGNYTVFENGVYTACAPCKDDPKKPPLWQVKGVRIIDDQTEKMLYFENAQLEFFGVPMAYLPYFSTPDPTVKRKTGFLMPGFSSVTGYGFGVETPFYWAIAPDYDATFNPRFTTRQGVLFQGEFRQRLINGLIRSAPTALTNSTSAPTPVSPATATSAAASKPRASSRSTINGCGAGTASCCPTSFSCPTTGWREYRDPRSVPEPADRSHLQLYLSGVGDRSFFDLRTIYYLSFWVTRIRFLSIHPVLDYSNVINSPIFGGEFSYKIEPDQPVAGHRGVRPDYDGGQPPRPVSERVGRSAGADCRANVCSAVYQAPTRGRPSRGSGGNRSPIRSARSGRRSPSCAPTRSTPRFRTSRAFRTSSRSATPRRYA